MIKILRWCLSALLMCGTLALSAAPVVLPEKIPIRTSAGTFTLWHRSPASEADLGMPIPAGSVPTTSFVYRVRDRKEHDLLYFTRVHVTLTQSAAAIRKVYLEALGTDAVQSTDEKTGITYLSAGEPDNFRLVTITPNGTGCDVRLERQQEFTVPPRVFTQSEQQVIDALEAIALQYQTATHVAYTVAQRSVVPKEQLQTDKPPVLTWTVDFTPPSALTVTAGVEGTQGLRITSTDHVLHVSGQAGRKPDRPITGKITLGDVPELSNDPVARLLFGDPLITDLVDTLELHPLEGISPKEKALIMLGIPDEHQTLRLYVDLQKHTVFRSETVTNDEGRITTIERTYTRMEVTAPAAATPQPASKSTSPAVGPGT